MSSGTFENKQVAIERAPAKNLLVHRSSLPGVDPVEISLMSQELAKTTIAFSATVLGFRGPGFPQNHTPAPHQTLRLIDRIGFVDVLMTFDSAGGTPLEAGDIQLRVTCRAKRCFLGGPCLHVVSLKRLIGRNTRSF